MVEGLWPAIVEYLTLADSWRLVRRYENMCGLTVLQRSTAAVPRAPLIPCSPLVPGFSDAGGVSIRTRRLRARTLQRPTGWSLAHLGLWMWHKVKPHNASAVARSYFRRALATSVDRLQPHALIGNVASSCTVSETEEECREAKTLLRSALREMPFLDSLWQVHSALNGHYTSGVADNASVAGEGASTGYSGLVLDSHYWLQLLCYAATLDST
eukprot:TRINITY_DN56493_c0_g1_i1.p1 TRINITY_DN56493_c0_g1~~TRINITY_DN56493_c0_g1_i1.p1  ORF type:complete len:213 (-),score=31.19 TRINITY_DN56493_c0_g1_i1:556-1194(-)